MNQNNNTFIFIPDISGFTHFVNNTEIEHSRHIMTELLELIINSDQLGLLVSEIEGDAVLCYKTDDIPSVESIFQQCEQTFINFHNHLRRYASERICRCGACETAVNLTLKFIVHAGPVEFINIKTHQKLHGFDVVLAHLLLKNQISEHEYVLFSEKFELQEAMGANVEQSLWRQELGSSTYQSVGEVPYRFISLKHLHKKVKEPDPVSIPGLGPDKFSTEVRINASVDNIYERFTDFDKRQEWNENIQQIISKNDRINKAGAIHTCLVGSNSLEIESLGREENDNRIVYGERVNKFKGLQDILTIYTFDKKENETVVTVDLDFKVNSFLSRLFKPMIRKMILAQTKKGLQKLKKISEAK